MADDTSVRVAVRIRPQIPREILEMCHVCTSVTPGEPQVVLGKDKGFTFDNVFDIATHQDSVYDSCISPLIEGCLEGYNATVLAYGQTGSGKTYTMGTGLDINMTADERGVIPRAVEHLFKGIAERQNKAKERGEAPPEFKINAQFMELYNEEINDLLNSGGDLDDKGNKMHIKIHEDSRGGIYTVGVTTRNVSTIEETLQCLKMGALSRTTGSTQMNSQSSRSHAIFTLHVKQQRIVQIENVRNTQCDMDDECYQEPLPEQEPGLNEFETLTAKFHFVDLAGSERLKRTGATGERAREGISINCGLLALGNVISALGDKSRRVSHVPYRDSKLTRLLQDSLGGNSRTLMIACVSPSDRDFMETLNTLKYANRAKNIKNKVMLNQDKSSQTISLLRREIQRLEVELMEYKQGKRIVGEDGSEQINDMFHENTMLQTENNNLRSRIKALQETVERLTVRNSELLAEKQAGAWITSEDGSKSDITEMIQGYIKEVEDIRAKLMESEEMCAILRRNAQRSQSRVTLSPSSGAVAISGHYDIIDSEHQTVFEVLQDAKKDVKRLKKKTKKGKESEGNEMVTSTTTDAGLSGGEEEKQDESEMVGEEDGDEKDMNGVDDAEESSDSEGEEEKEHIHEDLADLTCEITIKEKLIMELEQSQRRLITMRHHYEEKLTQLQMRIKETELERDRVLASLGIGKENQGEEKVKKVKEQFEKKLSTLQNELKKMQAAKKEHANLMRTQSKYELQMKQLKDEVLEMKKTKVRLMNQMKEASSRHKLEEKRRIKEMEQIKKDSRKKDVQLRKLETEKRLKENILRRKQEEVNALKRMAKPMSDKVAGRVGHLNFSTPNTTRRQLPFSPKQAKQKWQHLEKNITKLVHSKQSVYNVERDMDRWLHEREKLSRILERIAKKREKAVQDGKGSDTIRDMEEQIDNLRANIDYVRENIYECQSSIAEIEDTKDDMSALDVNNLINNMKFAESSYFIEKLMNMAISQSFNAAQKDTCVKELEAKLQQMVESNSVQQQLLQHLLHQNNEDMYNVYLPSADADGFESASSSRSPSPVDSSVAESQQSGSSNQYARRNKARRKTATPEDLLYPRDGGMEAAASRVESLQEIPESSPPISVIPSCMTASCPKETLDRILMPPPINFSALQESMNMHRVTSAPGSLREMVGKPKLEPSPLLGRKTYGFPPDVSPSLRRKNFGNANNYPPSPPSRQNSVDTTASDYSPPGSPTASRRNLQRDDNVFSRLTSGIKKTNKPDRGLISNYQGRNPSKTAPLVCTHVAEGHSKAVLSVSATDDVLFSSSKDRTVKIWDLHTGQEIQSLSGHPNNVVTVKYCEYTRLAFSVSAAYIKVWDVRENPAKCVKTLSSSGSTTNGPVVLQTPSRTSQVSMGESQINDIALNHYGTTLYSASGNIVRIWDLKMFSCIGRLSGGHQAAVMCLAVDDIGMDNNVVVTGSKDHYIKVFAVVEGVGGVVGSKVNLEPPHYDGIQSLAICGDYLFSGSRDTCIKKWDLSNNSLVQSVNQAHKDWICGLSFLPSGDVLLSACRGGYLKLWSTDSCQLMGEIRAHIAPINAVTTNSSAIFTASNDNNISLWRLRVSNETSPDYSDFGDERFH